MFLEIIPDLYDAIGRRSFEPHLKRKLPPPTFPFGRYVDRPLAIHCSSLQEVRAFLLGCRQASDQETFGKDDYWLPPDEFENLRQGDCDDFALWTWRQLMQMGYKARFVVGGLRAYRPTHGWVTFKLGDKNYIADGTRAALGKWLPRIQNLKYHPIYSVEWNGKNILFCSHTKEKAELGLVRFISYVPEWMSFWMMFYAKNIHRLPLLVFRYLKRRLMFSTD